MLKILVERKKGQDYTRLQQYAKEMEEKAFEARGSSHELYMKTIQGWLVKTRGSPTNVMEWFSLNKKNITQLLQKEFLSATICPEISSLLLASSLTPETWNTEQLKELEAVKAAFPKAVAAFKAASTIPPVGEALQNIVCSLDQACLVIEQALHSANAQKNADVVAPTDEEQFCGSLSVKQLHDIVTIVSNFLTPFFISLRENAKGDAAPELCALCSQSSSARDQRSMQGISHSLSQKFEWNIGVSKRTEMQGSKESSRCDNDADMQEDAAVAEVLCANSLRRLLWLNNYVSVDSEAVSPRCSTVVFVEEHSAHFAELNSWLRDLLVVLRRSVIPNVPSKSSSSDSISKSVGTSTGATDVLSRDNKSTQISTTQTLNFNFNEKRALNLSSNKSLSPKKRMKLSQPTVVSELAGSGGPFSTLLDVLAVLQKLYNVQMLPSESVTSAATSLDTLQYLQLQVPVENLINEFDNSFPCAFLSEGEVCRVDIALDEQSMPLHVIINASSGAVTAHNGFCHITEKHCALSWIQDTPLVFRRPDSDYLLPLYRKMNVALSCERSKLDLPMRTFASSADQLNVFFKILSGFFSRFDLSVRNSDDTASNEDVASPQVINRDDNFHCYPQECQEQPLVSRVNISEQSGQVSVSCSSAEVSC